MLEADPEAVHLREVLEDELVGVLDVSSDTLVLAAGVGELVAGGLGEVVAKEEAAGGVLDALRLAKRRAKRVTFRLELMKCNKVAVIMASTYLD